MILAVWRMRTVSMASIEKTNKNLYKNGRPFSETLVRGLGEQVGRIDYGKASLVIVDGGVGNGKTTLGVHIADYIQGSEIDLDNQLAVGGNDFVKKLYQGTKKDYKVVIYDESGDFDRRGAISRFNRMLNRIFDTYRTFQIVIILILPSFKVLENDIFDKKIPRILLNTHNKTSNYASFRAYSLYRMYLLKNRMQKLNVPPQAYNLITPNFRGHFKDLSPERSKKLDKISSQAKQDILEEYNLIEDGLLSYKDMARELSKSVIWVKQKVSELRLKHEKTLRNTKYFNEEVLKTLEGEVQRR